MRINGFEQIKGFYSWVFNNQDKNVKPHHVSLYIFMVNQNNRNNWIEWFKMPFDLSMAGACISSKKTYYNCLSDLMEWGLIEYTKGVNNWKAPLVRLEVLKDTSTVPQSEPQLYLNDTSTGDSTVPQRGNKIKQVTNNLQQETINDSFDSFWKLYPGKIAKVKCEAKWNSLKESEKEKIIETLPAFIKHKPFASYNHPNPLTYLNQQRWNDVLNSGSTAVAVDTKEPKPYVKPYNPYTDD